MTSQFQGLGVKRLVKSKNFVKSVLLLAAIAASASFFPRRLSAASFSVDYTTTSGETCITSTRCVPLSGSLLPPPFTETFTLPTGDLSVNGEYDVLSSFSLGLSGTADAVVSGGQVTDLLLNLSGGNGITQFSTFSASNGAFSAFSDFAPFSPGSATRQGVYSISQTPEPSTFALMSGAILVAGFAIRKIRRHRAL